MKLQITEVQKQKLEKVESRKAEKSKIGELENKNREVEKYSKK